MNCTRPMIRTRRGQAVCTLHKARGCARQSFGRAALRFFARVAVRSLQTVRSGVMRPLISAGVLFAVVGMVGGMEQGRISPVAALPICLILILATLAVVKE